MTSGTWGTTNNEYLAFLKKLGSGRAIKDGISKKMTKAELQAFREMTRYIQIQNPRSKLWVKIDRQEGRIMQHKKSPGPFKGITKVNQKTNNWQGRVKGIPDH